MAILLQALLHAVPRAEPADRVRDFLTRQNVWFETLLGKLKGIAHGEGEADLSSLIENDSALAEERARYDRESEEVGAEWRKVSETLPEKTRAEIRALARRGESLAEEIRAEYARVIGDLEIQTAGVKGALEALAHGRSLLRRYAPGPSDDAMFIDRKA